MFPISHGRQSGRALLERRTIYTPDRSDPVAAIDFPEMETRSPTASLAVPLVHEGEAIGVLALHRDRTDGYTPRVIALVETFAAQAAIAIANARLFQDLQQSNRQVTEALEQQTATAEILRVIASSPTDVTLVFDRLLRSALALCGGPGDCGAIFLVEGQALVRGAISAPPDLKYELERAAPIPVDRAYLSGRAILDRTTQHTVDRTVEPGIDAGQIGSVGGFRSELVVPLMREGTPIGAIGIARRIVAPFTQRQIEAIQTFADQAVIAIENARLFSELQEANQQLAEASQHKSQFLANMCHELRTPLNAIIGYSEMLQEEAEDLDQQSLIPDLQRVNAAGKHLLGLINDILDLSKIEAGRMDLYLETFEVGQLVRDVEAIVRPLVEKNGNTLVVACPDDLGTMHADQTKLRQALFNLLSNAAKFTERGSIELRVASCESEESESPLATHNSLS